MREGQEDGPERRGLASRTPGLPWCWRQNHLQRVWGQRGPCACPTTAPGTHLTPPWGSSAPMGQGGWAGGFEGISLPAWTSNTTRGM